MRLVSTTTNPKLSLGLLLLIFSITASAQENSPYSRYGLGDRFPSKNVVNRGMGGLVATTAETQSINSYNPASYSNSKIVTFDVGVSIDSRTLKSANPVKKYASTNFTPSYVAIGFPLNRKKNLGLAFGLRPQSTINYSIQERVKISGGDSIARLYEGNGGLYQLFGGIGKRWGNFSIGFNGGYSFGRKETNTKVFFINDTIDFASSNSATVTTYGKAFLDAGLQYQFNVSKNSFLRLGATATFKQSLKAKQDIIRETFQYDANGAPLRVDSAFQSTGFRGTINIPGTYSAGLLYTTFVTDRLGNNLDKTSIGFEYETTKWTDYRFYQQKDAALADAWQARVGAQYTPDPLSVANIWNHVAYRAGLYFGKDKVTINSKQLPVFAVTFGAGIPVRRWRTFESQYTIINTAIEVGKRGNKDNNITENFFRLSFGLSLSDVSWFQKRRYD